MNFLKNLKYYFCVVIAAGCIMACSDSKDKDGDGNGDYSDSPLTPDEHKSKLENIGKDFVAKFKAEDHETVVNSLYNLSDILEGSNFDDFLPDYLQSNDYNYPYMLTEVIRHNDANALMKLATKALEDDKYQVSDFAGIYTYNSQKRTWARTDATNKVELHYTVDGVTSVLGVTFSDITQYTKADGIIVDIPAKTAMALTVNNQKVMSFTTDINLAKDMYSADIKSTLALGDNYTWEINASAKSDKATAAFKMTVKGEELINGTAELTGTKLTDPGYIEDNGEDIFNTAKMDFTVMGIRMAGNADIKAIIKGEDNIGDMYPWSSNFTEAADKKNAEALMALYNDYMKVEGFYTAEKQKFVDIKMGLTSSKVYRWNPSTDKGETVTDWDIQPILVFTDKSEMEFETFFTETRFSSLISAVETLVNSYIDLVGEDHIEL